MFCFAVLIPLKNEVCNISKIDFDIEIITMTVWQAELGPNSRTWKQREWTKRGSFNYSNTER